MEKFDDKLPRCEWVSTDPLYIDYHDNEWGIPKYNDRDLFELLILEGAQAGLSWITILRKRENYRLCFDNFNVEKILHYDEIKINSLLQNPGIIRNRLKIMSVIENAKAYVSVLQRYNSFSEYIWQFVEGKPIINNWTTIKQIPSSTELSDKMSKILKKDGFKFVGSTICYAFMQATGMVNDHTRDCFCYIRN
ncbi:MAG: DNA-3-methyladenine glycosylase I [Neisseriaceae bacterium]